MTILEYDNLKDFPVKLMSLSIYESEKTTLKPGDIFTGIKKVKIGTDDLSIIDENGHPHHYTGCVIYVIYDK